MDNARTEHLLVGKAEPIAVLGMVNGNGYPVNELNRAWRFLLECHTHDAIAGCAPDNVCADMEYRFRQSRDLAETVVDNTMQYIVKNLNLEDSKPDDVNIVIFNSLPYPRSENIQLEISFPVDTKAQGLRIVPYNSMVGAQFIAPDSNGLDKSSPYRGDINEIEYQLVSVTPDSFFVDSIWDVPKYTDVIKFTVIGKFNDIPALGYKTFNAIPLNYPITKASSLYPNRNVLENAFIRAEIQLNGTIDILHKPTGKIFKGLNYFSDQGEAGNAWRHASPKNDIIQNSLDCHAKISLVKDGPLEAEIRAELAILVPEDIANRNTPNGKKVELKIVTFYTLKLDDPKIYVKTIVENNAKDHWLRAIFPSSINADTVYAETQFDVVQRTIVLPDTSDWLEPMVGTAPMQSLVSLNDNQCGLSILSEGLYEYEVFDKPEQPIALSLLRGLLIKLAVSEEKQQLLPDEGPQCLGKQIINYAIYPHSGDWFTAKTLQEAERYRTPLEAIQTGCATGSLPLEQSAIDITNSEVIITCIKKAEVGAQFIAPDMIIVRGYNPRETDSWLRLQTSFPIQECSKLSIDERFKEKITHSKYSIELLIPKKKIFTLGITQPGMNQNSTE